MNNVRIKATTIGLLLLANLLVIIPPIGADTSSRSAADITVTESQVLGGPHFKDDNITITALIKNLGTENATNVTVHFEAWNNTLSTPIDLGNDTTIGYDNGGANLTFNSTVLVTIHWDTAKVGKTISPGLIYSINVTASNKTDASSSNDEAQTSVQFLDEPYLAIIKALPSATSVPVGAAFNISYNIENIGSKSQDVLGDNLQLFLDAGPVALESHAVQGLTPHQIAQGLFLIDTKGIMPGNHTFKLALQNAGRNVTTENISFLAPNPSIGDLEWTPVNGSVGDIITINATINNNGTADAKDLAVKFYVDPPYIIEAYSNTIYVPAGGSNVSTFQWVTTNEIVGNHTVLVSLKPAWPSENVTTNITLVAGGVPDLSVVSLTLVPSEVDIGEIVNITAVVKNAGTWPSTSTNLSIRYIKGLESQNLAMVPVKALAAGASTAVNCLWNTTGLEFWNYGVWVHVDPEGDVTDSNLANNKANATLKLKAKPDLLIGTLNMTMGRVEATSIHKGESATINVIVRNIGTKASGPTTVSLYLDNATNPVTTQNLFGMSVDGEQGLLYLWDTTLISVGNHTFKAIVDPLGNNTELNETNNILTLTVQVLEPKGQVDMVVLMVSINPQSPVVGEFVAITAVIKNNGTTKAANVTVIFSYYIAQGGNVPIDTQVIPTVGAGEEVTRAANWATGPLASGNYTLNVTADPLNELHEKDRSNNYKTLPMTLAPKGTGPGKVSLKVIGILFDPVKPKSDENVKVTVTVKNTGDRDATDVRVILMVDGIELGTKTTTVAKNGATSSVEFNWKPSKGMHEVEAQAFLGTSAVYDDHSSVVIKASDSNQARFGSYLPLVALIIVILIVAIVLLAMRGKDEGKAGKEFIEEDHEDDEDLPDEDDETEGKGGEEE